MLADFGGLNQPAHGRERAGLGILQEVRVIDHVRLPVRTVPDLVDCVIR